MSYDNGGISERDANYLYTRGLAGRLERAERELLAMTGSRNEEKRRAHDLEAQLTDAHTAVAAAADRSVHVTFPEWLGLSDDDKRQMAHRVGEEAGLALLHAAHDFGGLQRRATILEWELMNRLGPGFFPLMAHDGGLALEATKGGTLQDELTRTRLELRKVKDDFAAYRLRDSRRPMAYFAVPAGAKDML